MSSCVNVGHVTSIVALTSTSGRRVSSDIGDEIGSVGFCDEDSQGYQHGQCFP